MGRALKLEFLICLRAEFGDSYFFLKDVGFGDRCAELGFQKIKIAAAVGLQDVIGEHPTIPAIKAARQGLPFGAAALHPTPPYRHPRPALGPPRSPRRPRPPSRLPSRTQSPTLRLLSL